MSDVRQFPHVPIVGQPIEVHGYTIIVNVLCKCDHPTMITLIVKQTMLGRTADLGICPQCGRTMSISGVSFNQAGQLEFSVGFGDPQPRPDAAAAHLTN